MQPGTTRCRNLLAAVLAIAFPILARSAPLCGYCQPFDTPNCNVYWKYYVWTETSPGVCLTDYFYCDSPDPYLSISDVCPVGSGSGSNREVCDQFVERECVDRIDYNGDGCVGAGCVLGTAACPCVGQCADPYCATWPPWGVCDPYNGNDEICGDGVDNNCNGLVDEGCSPKESPTPPDPTAPKQSDALGANGCGDTAGNDPILLANQSVVTEPFTDFSVDTGLLQLGMTRTYSSSDWSYSGGPTGYFGRGWHQDWEGWLTCDTSGVCTVAFGGHAGYQFQASFTAQSLDGTETWQIYSLFSSGNGGILIGDNHNVLVRRPAGEWIMYTVDGRELHFESACDSCGASDSFCQDAATGGKARLVKVVDRKGNAVQLTYNRPAGVLLQLADELGHSVQLLSTTGCSDGLASSLVYDGMTVATYSYSGSDLAQVTDGDGKVLRGYVYDTWGTQRLLAVTNEAGDAIASFSYDAAARAIGVIDKTSSVSVTYNTTGSPQVTEFYGGTSSTSARTLDRDGHATTISDGCSCGSARTLQWTNRRLTCVSDALNHVTWQEFNGQGALTHRAEYTSTLGCAAPPGTLSDVEAREEMRIYGLSRTIAQGFTMGLDSPTMVSTGNQTTSNYKEGMEYNPWVPHPDDPAGYACEQAPLPSGSVICQRWTGATTYTSTGDSVWEYHSVYYSYDVRGRLIKTIGPVATATDMAPVEVRTYWPDTETLPRRGRLYQVSRYPSPTGTPLVTTYDYDAFGPYQITQPNGGITIILKDGRGRPISIVAADGGLYTTRYHDGFDPRVQLAPSGSATRSNYDSVGRLAGVEYLSSDPDAPGSAPTSGGGEYYTYDAAGNRVHTERRDGTGSVTWQQDRQYDVQHRLVSETNPASPGAVKTYAFDASGFLTTVTDEVGRTTKYTPDGINRVKTVTRVDPTGTISLTVAQYAYQVAGDAMSEADDGKGLQTHFLYDYFGRLSTLGSQDINGYGIYSAYDARGNVLERTHAYVNVAYTYDGLDRVLTLSATNSDDGSSIAYTYRYDEGSYPGLLTTVVEADRTLQYTYDIVGRLTSETIQENGVSAALVTQYVYNSDGDVSDIVYPSGLHVQMVRDPATRQVIQVNNVDNGTHYADQVTYEPGGPVTSLSFGNGATLSQTFNRRYEPQTISSGPLALGYGMTPAGDVGSMTEGTTTRSFDYDFLERLTGSGGWLSYGYDGNGNRVSETIGRVSGSYLYAFGNDQVTDKLGATGKSEYAFGYDSQRNLSGVSLFSKGKVTKGMCLRHDALGRLVLAGDVLPAYLSTRINCTQDSQATATAKFKYDARGRRVARWLATTNEWTYIVSDAAGNPLSELVKPPDPTSPWTRVRDYVYLDGKPLAQIEYPGPVGSTQGYVYYYHLDHIGLPRYLTNATRQTVWSATERPYGDIGETTATDPLSGRTVVTNLRLPGQYDERLLGSLGLQGPYYNQNRWYLPGVGRYLELDPIAIRGGLNGRGTPDWYNYALGNPLRFTDEKGLCIEDACILEAAALLAGAAALVAAWETYVAQCTAAGTCPWSPKKCKPVPMTPPRIDPFPIPAPPPIDAGKGCSCVCYERGKGPNAIGWKPSAYHCKEACNSAGYSGYKCGGDVKWN